MAAIRPTVTVYNVSGAPSGSVPLPAVFGAPIRRDVVHFVHTNIAKNARQPYAVSDEAGMQHSAESWGTGRAVSRIPRIGGGGTHRSGQGAFGNMCRKGRMFAPTKVWRRWHRKVNVNQRRYAIVSALAASAVPALVMARGHRVDGLAEVPLVVAGLGALTKTKDALATLTALGADADVERAKESKTLRSGKGKMRNRRYLVRRGPLLVHAGGSAAAPGESYIKAFRNLPGVDIVHVDRLNLLQLAPGGHLGRFVIWTADAFERLEALFGSGAGVAAPLKTGFHLPRAEVAVADLARLINSSEVQAVVRPAVKDRRFPSQKKNPLRNHAAMVRLNPYAATVRKLEVAAQEARAKAKKAGKKSKRAGTRTNVKLRRASKAKFAAIASDAFVRPTA